MPGNKDVRVGNGQMAQWVKYLVQASGYEFRFPEPKFKNKNTKYVSDSVNQGDQKDPRAH